jgi:hypothetical protein
MVRLPKATVTAGHRLADAAKTGDWPAVMKLLDEEKVVVPYALRTVLKPTPSPLAPHRIEQINAHLHEVISWHLEPRGMRQMHVITHEGAVLVSEEPA